MNLFIAASRFSQNSLFNVSIIPPVFLILCKYKGFLRKSQRIISFFAKTHQSSLTLKGGTTSHLGLLPSGKKRKPLLLVALNHFILWLADHQRSTPAAELRFAGCDRLAELIACSLLKGCLLVAYSLLSLLLARYRKAACSLLAERLLIPCRKGGFSRPIPVNLVCSEQQECFSNCLSLRPATVGS